MKHSFIKKTDRTKCASHTIAFKNQPHAKHTLPRRAIPLSGKYLLSECASLVERFYCIGKFFELSYTIKIAAPGSSPEAAFALMV